MQAAEFGDFVGGVAVAGSNFSQVFARHAIEAVDGSSVVASSRHEFVKRSPFVSPVEVEAHALAQFVLSNLPPVPLVENMLVAREHGLQAQYDRTLIEFVVAQQRGDITLGVGQ